MKKVMTLMLCGMLVFGTASISASAASLDDVVNGNQTKIEQQETQAQTPETQPSTNNQTKSSQTNSGSVSHNSGNSQVSNGNYLNELKDATDLSETSATATNVNNALKKLVTIVVQVLAYAVTALLTLRVVIDLMYVAIPFSRTFLGNGYMGNAQVGAGGMPNSQMQGGMAGGMGGMQGGMGGMGMSRYGGMGGMGMNRGMGGMAGGMGAMNNQMAGASQQPNMTGRIQWVSNAALNAVAGENIPGPDGRAVSPFKLYVKDMTVVLVITPILLVLAMTGTLTNLGFLLGDAIAKGIAGVGSMI